MFVLFFQLVSKETYWFNLTWCTKISQTKTVIKISKKLYRHETATNTNEQNELQKHLLNYQSKQ